MISDQVIVHQSSPNALLLYHDYEQKLMDPTRSIVLSLCIIVLCVCYVMEIQV